MLALYVFLREDLFLTKDRECVSGSFESRELSVYGANDRSLLFSRLMRQRDVHSELNTLFGLMSVKVKCTVTQSTLRSTFMLAHLIEPESQKSSS